MLSKEELYIFWGGEIIRYRMFFNHVYPFFSFHPYFLAYMIKYTQILYSFGTKHPPTFIFIIFSSEHLNMDKLNIFSIAKPSYSIIETAGIG